MIMKRLILSFVLSLICYPFLCQNLYSIDTAFADFGMLKNNCNNYPVSYPVCINSYVFISHINDDGSFYLAGRNNGANNQYFVSKFTTDGKHDTTFGSSGAVYGDFNPDSLFYDEANKLLKLNSGKFIVSGTQEVLHLIHLIKLI